MHLIWDDGPEFWLNFGFLFRSHIRAGANPQCVFASVAWVKCYMESLSEWRVSRRADKIWVSLWHGLGCVSNQWAIFTDVQWLLAMRTTGKFSWHEGQSDKLSNLEKKHLGSVWVNKFLGHNNNQGDPSSWMRREGLSIKQNGRKLTSLSVAGRPRNETWWKTSSFQLDV